MVQPRCAVRNAAQTPSRDARHNTDSSLAPINPSTLPNPDEKKHPCPDCRCCQLCSEARCRVCRTDKKKPAKMSLEDQIALYNKKNKDLI